MPTVHLYDSYNPQAGQLTNQQVIDRLPEARRPAAQALLSRYCEGFNLTLPCIPLFECKDNPYLTTEKKLVRLHPTGTMARAYTLTRAFPCACMPGRPLRQQR